MLDFIQDQVLGMKWLSEGIGRGMSLLAWTPLPAGAEVCSFSFMTR